MIKVRFAVVPPGGGETDYTFEKEVETVPMPGDYVFRRDFEEGQPPRWAAFIVRRRWFWPGEFANIVAVELEPARYAKESPNHKRSCQMYETRGKPLQRIQQSID